MSSWYGYPIIQYLWQRKSYSMEQENQIYRLTFDVDFPASIGDDDAMAAAESCCETHVIPTIGGVLALFDNYNIGIESITLDLGRVSKDEIPIKLKSMLEEEIKRHLYYSSHEQSYEIVEMGEKGTAQSFKVGNHGKQLLELGVAPALLPYLFEGVLSWQYAGLEQAFLPDLWNEVSRVLANPSQADLLFSGLSNEPLAVYRFVNLLNTAQLKVLLSSSVFLGEGAFRNLLMVLESIKSKEPRFLLRHALSVVAYAIIGKYWDKNTVLRDVKFMDESRDFTQYNTDNVVQAVFAPIVSETAVFNSNEKVNSISVECSNGFEMFAGADGVLRKQEMAIKNPYGKNEAKANKELITENDNEEAKVFLEKLKVREQEMMASREFLMEVTDEVDSISFYVDDIGLVLLHPFLPDLFDRLGYLSEKRGFKSIEKRERAVHLLRYMAGLPPPYYDYQLVLEKVLCDLPIGFPVSLDVELEEKEKEEAMQVLGTVCQYWRPLNGISPEGLQHSFLQRLGCITYEDHTWMARVEGQALDVLLDDLPWEISLLLLPWKEDLIMVEWQRE